VYNDVSPGDKITATRQGGVKCSAPWQQMGKEESGSRDDGIISIGIALFNEKDLERWICFRETTCNDTTCRTTYLSQLMSSQKAEGAYHRQ
jgi:hypothetical protein